MRAVDGGHKVPLKSMCRTEAFYWRGSYNPAGPMSRSAQFHSRSAWAGNRPRPGGGLRVDRLGLEELSTDEAFSWRMTTHASADIVARTATDVHPPLYYLALEAWTAVAGDSLAALRALSMLLGLAVVVLAYLLYLEVDRHAGEASPRPGGWERWWPPSSSPSTPTRSDTAVTSGCTAWGSRWPGSTAWLMLRALRSERRAGAWWAAYALAAAALCYTHYYGAFTVAAQMIGAAIVLAERGRASRSRPREVLGLLAAALAVAALFAPWLSVLRRQTARVSRDYWIREAGSDGVASGLVGWLTGFEWAPPLPAVTIVAFAAAGLWALARGDRGQRVPRPPGGAAMGGGSWGSRGRPAARSSSSAYLFFSQLALLVFLARAWAGLPPWPRRATGAPAGRCSSPWGSRTRWEGGRSPRPPPRRVRGSWRSRSRPRTSCSPTRRAISTSSATTCIAKGPTTS